MNKIFSVIRGSFVIFLSFLFIVLLICIKNTSMDEGKNLCSCSDVYDESIDSEYTRGVFNGTATALNLGIQNGNAFLYQGQKLYFSFKSENRQFIKLNYSGYSAKLKIFNKYYFNSNDYLFYSSNINNDIDIIYCEPEQTYIFEFESITSGLWTILLTLESLSLSMSNHQKYVMHLTYTSSSTFGYRYDVEYKNISLYSASNTSSYCNNLGYYATYLDLIDNSLNFGIINDSRRLITDTRAPEYSAVAYNLNAVRAYNLGDTSYYTTYYRGSGTFVDDTTVIGAAHCFYVKDESVYGISKNTKFYPGANSYDDSVNWYKSFGEYTATNTYLPISYILAGDSLNRVLYDWSISLTTNTYPGLYNHSYMGLYYTNSNSLDYVHSVGYPSVINCPSGNTALYARSMWTYCPLENVVDCSFEDIPSSTIVVTQGNSGGPLYRYIESYYNGTYYGSLQLIGICSLGWINANNQFYLADWCKINPVIINMYEEVI